MADGGEEDRLDGMHAVFGLIEDDRGAAFENLFRDLKADDPEFLRDVRLCLDHHLPFHDRPLPQQLADLIKWITDNPLMFNLIVAIILFIVGTALESNAAYIMLVPLFHPIAMEMGLDPLHFGFLFVFNLVIGMLTPPVAVVLMVVQGVSGVETKPFMKEVWPFVWVQYGVLLLCMLFPPIVTWLPRTMGY